MNTTPKKLLALSVAVLSLSAFADAQAGHRDGYRHSHRSHVADRAHPEYARARHYRGHKHPYKHHYRHAPRYRPAYVPRYVAYPAPVYVSRPAYSSGATIWVDGFGFSFYTGH